MWHLSQFNYNGLSLRNAYALRGLSDYGVVPFLARKQLTSS